jgi:hypothetical protein
VRKRKTLPASLDNKNAHEISVEEKKTHEGKAHLKDTFLAHFLTSGTILQGSKLTGIQPTTVEYWREYDPAFEKNFQKTDALITESLVTAAHHRAVYGVPEYVISHGKLVLDANKEPLVKRNYSDLLVMFLLKSRDREKYSDRMKHEIDERFAQVITSEFVNAIRKAVPQVCPGCNTHLGLDKKIAEELKTLSAKLSVH